MTFNQTYNRAEFTDHIEAEIWAKRNAKDSCLPYQRWRVALDAELKKFFIEVYSINSGQRQGYAQ